MKYLKATILTAALAASAASSSVWAATAQSWNLARDMYLMTEGAPAGSPWSFMQNKGASNVPTSYTLLPTFDATACSDTPMTCWREAASRAYVATVKQTYTFTGSGGTFVFKQGDVVTHPGINSQSIIRWTSPVSGNISVLGRVNDLHGSCGDGVAWSLNLEDTILQTGNLANRGSSTFKANDVAVTEGAALYLVIDKKSNYSCDATSLDLIITN